MYIGGDRFSLLPYNLVARRSVPDSVGNRSFESDWTSKGHVTAEFDGHDCTVYRTSCDGRRNYSLRIVSRHQVVRWCSQGVDILSLIKKHYEKIADPLRFHFCSPAEWEGMGGIVFGQRHWLSDVYATASNGSKAGQSKSPKCFCIVHRDPSKLPLPPSNSRLIYLNATDFPIPAI